MLELNYLRVKKIILKRYIKQNVYIEVKGNIDTRVSIRNARILVTRRKIILSNEELDFTIDLYWVKKVKIEDGLRITFIYDENLQVSLEV